MFNKVCVDELELEGKRVLVRVDFNVPVKEGRVTDDIRMRESLPTIRYARDRKARVILCAHLGRPKGKPSPALSLRPVAAHLSELLAGPVGMAEDCIGAQVQADVARLQPGEVLLLENLRFHPEEEHNAADFARALAGLCDVYVNDAFGAAHRAHASTAGIARFVPVAACGFLMRKEIEHLGKLLTAPEHPFVAILGGAKVSDKIGVLKNLIGKVDTFLLGGAMAYTFLKAVGQPVGASLVEEDKLELARETMKAARAAKVAFLPASDHVVAERIASGAPTRVVDGPEIPEGWMALDIGPKTREAFAVVVRGARTILWNGPMGVFETPPFDEGTKAVAAAIAASGAISIIGGGDTAAAVAQAGVADKMTHISTGGGASLEFLEGRELPGIAALTDKR
ncbi:MAG: phosphoglycerate kinase [Candidatus Methylomirabilales bacterium]